MDRFRPWVAGLSWAGRRCAGDPADGRDEEEAAAGYRGGKGNVDGLPVTQATRQLGRPGWRFDKGAVAEVVEIGVA